MTDFTELGLCEPLLKAVEEQGYERPMPIQEQVIPHLLKDGGDLIGLAQTGTGKTAAYGLPLLEKLNERQRPATKGRLPQCLILSPTRELCLQIADDMQSFASHLPSVRILAVYGGANIEPQIRALKGGMDIVVATPGRILDLMRRGAADLREVSDLVLDEADEMLSMGFHDELEAILEGLTSEHRSLLFSATMSKEIERIAQRYLKGATTIQVGSRNEGAENVNHIYYMVPAKDKYLALKRVVDYFPRIYAIIFCRTRVETQQVADNLIRDGYNAEALHGDLSQQQRDLTMQRFRGHRTQLLVATDVAARGLDVDDLTHVINYGMPDDVENYTHRSGRTGRAGKKGTSISIVHQRERNKIRLVEREIKKQFVREMLPNPKEICSKQLYHVIDEIERTEVDEEEIAPFMDDVRLRWEWLDKEDLVKRVLSREFGRFIRYYANAPEIEDVPENAGQRGKDGSQGKARRQKGDRNPEPGYARIFLTVSKADGYFAKEIIRMVNEHVRGGKVQMGRIDLLKNFSFIEVPEQDAERVISGLKGLRVKGRVVDAAIADSQGNANGPAAKSGRSAWSGGGGDRERRERAFQRDEQPMNRRQRRAEAAGRSPRGKRQEQAQPQQGGKKFRPSEPERSPEKKRIFRKEDWMKFLHPDQFTDVDEGSARRHPKKK
ncbi:MAG: DEAD/DEAH box helicase [Prevotellaceae bacterium]|nr:DEAD/DEAH box helicase [Prevotellaceae bacterium]